MRGRQRNPIQSNANRRFTCYHCEKRNYREMKCIMPGNSSSGVVDFYDAHPINEHQILDKISSDGFDPEHLTQDILQNYDQDHFGGIAANNALAALAGISPADHVVDVCCGMGGPARYFAHRFGCRVTGIDLTESRVESAKRLTAKTGLQDRVEHVCGDALDMPFEDGTFDVVVSQEAFCHVPRKDRLIAQCARVTKRGGRICFTDILTTDRTPESAVERLEAVMAYRDLGTAARYRRALERAGCVVVAVQDLGAAWRQILTDRLAMYRSLERQTVERFGEDHFRRWDEAYSFFVGLYATGELGGGRFLARKP